MFTETAATRRKRRSERAARLFFGLMSAAMVAPLLMIVALVLVKGAPAMDWEFLTQAPRRGGTVGGIWPALVGTLYLIVISLCVSAPIGVLAAVYLNEYARESWFTRLVDLAVVNLAGVPSVVHGLFGLGAFVYAMHFGKSILAAALTLSIMTLPVIISASEEALRAVPQSFRTVSISLGGSGSRAAARLASLRARLVNSSCHLTMTTASAASAAIAVFHATLGPKPQSHEHEKQNAKVQKEKAKSIH